MRRLLPLAVLVLALCGAALVPAAAGARPLASAPSTCPKPKPYPPAPNATVQSSTTRPTVGESIEASGTGYCADEDVTITIDGQTVGTAHTDASGNFDPQVTVPGPAGQKQLCGIGASGLATDRDCLTLYAADAAGQAANTGSGGGGGTAFTGTQILLLLLVALALLGGGAAFVTAGRRKQSASV